jgi:hypothetical protein
MVSMRHVVGILCVVAGAAYAETPVVAAAGETREECLARRRSMIERADREPAVSDRIAILNALPDCKEPAQQAPVVHVRSGLYADIGGGLGRVVTTFDGSLYIAVGGGVGAFLAPSVALQARVAGLVSITNAHGVIGFLGPTLQAWLSDQLVIGGGMGLGVSTCGDCTSLTGLGFEARVAFAPARDGHGLYVAGEVGYFRLGLSGETFPFATLLALVGYSLQ